MAGDLRPGGENTQYAHDNSLARASCVVTVGPHSNAG